jgi:hypothetical protein
VTAVVPAAPMSEAEYRSLVERARELAEKVVPPGATVAVISRGDPALVEVDGRQGWHFPQAESGVYAGHYPSDSADAIRQLEALRSKGAGFLLVPSTAFWWFRHYRDFKRHLDRRYALVTHDADACLYALDARAAEGFDAADLSPLRQKSLVDQIQDVVASTLPETDHLLVWMDAPTAFLPLEGRRVEPFPRSRGGEPFFGAPDSKQAILQLESLRSAGARYLVVSATAFSSLDQCPELKRHLEQRHTLAVNQGHLCRIYELGEHA